MDSSENIVWLALDFNNTHEALCMAEPLRPYVRGYKIGTQLDGAIRRELVTAENQTEAEFNLSKIRSLYGLIGKDLFFDGKLHDTPNTVAGAMCELAGINAAMSTVHAAGGTKMMRAAVANRGPSLVLAATILSSHSDDDVHDTFSASTRAKFLQFARRAVTTGCDGIVCSALELKYLKQYEDEFSNMFWVTPGIRLEDSPPDDQVRKMTPYEAVLAGADYLVIGRLITKAKDPVAVIKWVNAEVARAKAHMQKRAA